MRSSFVYHVTNKIKLSYTTQNQRIKWSEGDLMTLENIYS